jgi:tRNA(Arg) A34 adenosine deaminase TadA
MFRSISNKDSTFIHRALEVAKGSEMLMRHGCVVTDGHKFISHGVNSYRNRFNDWCREDQCSCHAEMDALRKAYHIKKNSFVVHSRKGYQI